MHRKPHFFFINPTGDGGYIIQHPGGDDADSAPAWDSDGDEQ